MASTHSVHVTSFEAHNNPAEERLAWPYFTGKEEALKAKWLLQGHAAAKWQSQESVAGPVLDSARNPGYFNPAERCSQASAQDPGGAQQGPT